MSFSAANASDPGGSIASYAWNFGDGSSANGVSVSKSYASAGNFTITLTLTDNCGASAMANASISISASNPCANNAAPVANAGPDQSGNPNVALSFSASGSMDVNGNSTIQSYWFNFGDGSFTGWQSSASASHAFVNVGSYTVRLWVRDNCGAMSASDLALVTIAAPNPCSGNTPPNAVITSPSSGLVNQSLNFSGLSSSDSTGTIQSYLWNFGDGQSGSGVNVSHSYASAGDKTVTLTLTDSCGSQGSMTRTIVITNPDPCANNQPPIAQASANPPSANINQSISFSANGSSDSNGSITSYSWNFGDGSSGSGLNASHTYANAGSFNVVLTVTDNCGATATKTISVSVINPNPSAGITVSRLTSVDPVSGTQHWEAYTDLQPTIELGLRVKFEAPTYTQGANLTMWSFMDTTGSSLPAPVHAFQTPGTYNVQLVVFDQNWEQLDTVTKTIHVAAGMQFLSALPFPGTAFRPRTATVVGNEAWSISWGNDVGVFRIDDPEHLNTNGNFEIVQFDLPYSPQCISSYGQHLYIPTNITSGGVRIYKADRDNFIEEGQILGPALTGSKASAAVVVGNALYVGVYGELRVLVYNLSNPVSPTLVTTLTFADPFKSMTPTAGEVLGVRHPDMVGGWRLSVVDVRSPLSPSIVGTPIQMPSIAGVSVPSAAGNVIVAPDVEGMGVVETNFGTGGVPSAELSSMIEPLSLDYAITNSHMFTTGSVNGGYSQVFKYNMIDRHAPYLMNSIPTAGSLPSGYSFVAQVPGYGAVLYLGGQSNGFNAYRP